MSDTCKHCGKDLARAKEVHAVEGEHFCSAECAMNFHMEETITNAKELAKKWYNDHFEIVTPIDIGIVREDIWTVYGKGEDITVIFRTLHTNDGEPISTEVVGFYYGEPDETSTERFIGSLKADFYTR